MARLGRKPVRPGRVTIAVSLGALGLFVISMATGLGTEGGGWPIGAVGAAMVIVAVALLTTASMRGGDKSYVQGTVHVVKVSPPPLIDTEFGRCEMQVLVDSPTHPGQTVMIRDPRVPVVKWPDVGDTLPALIAVSDARRIKIQWERVGNYGEEYDFIDDPAMFGDPLPPPTPPTAHDMTSEFPPVVPEFGPEPPAPVPPEPAQRPETPPEPLPRRKPSPTPTGSTHPDHSKIAVLEGELVPVDAPEPRHTAGDAPVAVTVDAISFSDDLSSMGEPDAPPSGPGSAFAENTAAHVLATRPAARPASAGSIHGVGITVQVSDLERAQRFYHDMLGFYEIDSGRDSVVLASGDTRIVLMRASQSQPVSWRRVHLNLEVGDVDAVYQELKVRGVRFTSGPKVVNQGERLELVAASFKDPDGNGIAITQWKARSPVT